MFKKREKGKRLKKWLLGILVIAVAGLLIWIGLTKLEGRPPEVLLSLESAAVPADFTVTGVAKDLKSGIRQIRIVISQQGGSPPDINPPEKNQRDTDLQNREIVLMDDVFPATGFAGKGKVRQMPFEVNIHAGKMGLSDGAALLKISVRDYSWRHWFRGNAAYLEKKIQFDTRPPMVSVLTNQHNVSPGGAGLVIYKLSEPCRESGVVVGEEFFPGHAGYFTADDIYLAFFAVPVDYDKTAGMKVKAVDPAGNESVRGFYHYVKKRRFVTDTLRLSENFLQMKLPEFSGEKGFPVDAGLADQFVFVNTVLRRQNNNTILANGAKTDSGILWEGPFIRMPNSARRANFGDQRVYQFNNQTLSNAVHMGIDLASVQHDRVPAANRGRVCFTGEAGIYGNLVCLDHGCGLMSLYAHLSRIAVQEGQLVEKGEIIGNTGATGLAGGDHLHFGMFVDHVFVDPVEWWDASWIANNITGKIQSVQALAP